MSPKAADPSVRTALLETAARILAIEGPGKLTLRHLTREVGTSTMAVYTYFGGMDELRQEVCNEGFLRLAAHLGAVEESGDPVADLVVLGGAYWAMAMENPNLYRAMFLDPLPGVGPLGSVPVGGREELETFEVLLRAVDRCIGAGRFDAADPLAVAVQLWGVTHGLVSLALAGMLRQDDAVAALAATSRSLFRGFGDDPRATGRSIARAAERA